MIDYSEVTATLPARVAKLSDELGRKRFASALFIAVGIAKDMMDIIVWITKQKIK